MKSAVFVVLMSLFSASPVRAQSEGGLLLGVEAEKELGKKLSLNVEAGLRTRNDFKTVDRWSGSLGVEYKLTKGLKVDANYSLLYDNNREKLTDKYWRPSYWGTRHRLNASLTGSYKVGEVIRLSLRERWQYTYRPEMTTDRYYFTDYPSPQWTGSMDGWNATEKVRISCAHACKWSTTRKKQITSPMPIWNCTIVGVLRRYAIPLVPISS